MMTHQSQMSLGEWLGNKIVEHGMTQTELAARVGVNQTQISSYLRGKRRPSPETCRRLAEVLAVPVDEVLIVAGHRPPVVADGDMELKEMVEILRQIPLDQRPPIKDYLQWQLDRGRRRWRYP